MAYRVFATREDSKEFQEKDRVNLTVAVRFALEFVVVDGETIHYVTMQQVNLVAGVAGLDFPSVRSKETPPASILVVAKQVIGNKSTYHLPWVTPPKHLDQSKEL